MPVLDARRDWLRRFVRERGVQTNEVQRSWVLLPCFLDISRRAGVEIIDLLEYRVERGLNLLLDRYRYRYDAGTWGAENAPLSLSGEERRPVPVELLRLRPRVRHRRGVDISPIDLTRPEDTLLLKSFVWADQTARLERLDRAVETLRSDPPALERGNVVERLPDLLAERQLGALTVVFATAVIGYLGKEGHDRIVAAVEEAGRQFPLAYLWTASTEARRARLLGHLGPAPARRRGAFASPRGLPRRVARVAGRRVITSPSNPRLRLVRRLAARSQRDRSGLFSCEGEDLVEAALAARLDRSISCSTPSGPLTVSPAESASSLGCSQKSRRSVTRRGRSASFVVKISQA